MTHDRATLCRTRLWRNFVVLAALAGAALSEGCGRFGYEPLISVVGDGGIGSSDAQRNDDALGSGRDTMQVRSGAFFSGQYLGSGMSGLKIAGVGFAPDVVFLHARSKEPSVFATRLMSPGRARVLSDFNASATTNIVSSFSPDGFELGAITANVSGVVGDYLALKATPGSLAFGHFAGDRKSRTVTGLGFAPGYVFVACDGRAPLHRSRTMQTTIPLTGNAGENLITSLDPDGFNLGADADVSQTQSDCQWFAVREGEGFMATTLFTGNKTAGRLVTLSAGLPQAVFVQCESVTSLHWVWKPLSLGADTDATFLLGGSGPERNLVQRVLPGGIEIGSDAQVNADGSRCHALAFGG